MEGENQEPKILAFLCNWCSYAGADLAGVSRFQYPPNVRIVRVMCSGRISPRFVIKSFQEGADGVLIAGCHPGDCHYSKGNYFTRRRLKILGTLLEHIGIDPGRFQIKWISASEGGRFADVIKEMTENVKKLGSNSAFKREVVNECH
jgi:coenzyme F420-reducing hydrogenase delta subunit